MQDDKNKPQDQRSKDIAELRYIDDFFARTCLKDNKAAVLLILNTILGTDDLTIESYETQSDILNIDMRSVILDVHAVDSAGKHYAIEIETTSTGAAPQRARFISGMLDSRLLNKRKKFKDLAESYVIFITEPDIFKDKRVAIRRFERYDVANGTHLNDGSHIIYVNGEYVGGDGIGKLIHDFLCKEPDEMYFDELAEPARFYKKTEEGQEIMGSVADRIRDEGFELGKIEGINLGKIDGMNLGKVEGMRESVKTMLKKGRIGISEISDFFPELTETDINAIKAEIAQPNL